MKRLLAIFTAAIIVVTAFAGCTARPDDKKAENATVSKTTDAASQDDTEQAGSDNAQSDAQPTDKKEITKFDGIVSIEWAAVEADYLKLEENARTSVENEKSIGKDYVKKLLRAIRKDAVTIVSGINKDNLKSAKNLYLNACKLDIVAQNNEKLVNADIKTLPEDAKNLVKLYHGVTGVDFIQTKTSTFAKTYAGESWLNNAWDEYKSLFKETDKFVKKNVDKELLNGVTADEMLQMFSLIKIDMNRYDYATVDEENVYTNALNLYSCALQLRHIAKSAGPELAAQLNRLADDAIVFSYHFVGNSEDSLDEVKIRLDETIDAISSMDKEALNNELHASK